MSIINLLSQIGTSNNVEIFQNINDLVKNFDLSKFSKSATNYNLDEVLNLNEKILQKSDFSYIVNRLKISNYDINLTEDFWLKIRSNINNLSEIKSWWNICNNQIRYNNNPNDYKFLQQASKLLPENLNSPESWSQWIANIKKNSDRKGKELFMPLRKAITGLEYGPELKYIITLIDRQEIIDRLCHI